jgi:hypothetical protein
MIWGNWIGKKMISTTGTLHIRSFASYSPDENLMYIYILNKNQTPAHVKLMIEGCIVDKVETTGQLTGKGPDDVKPIWNDHISLTKEELKNLELPGTSISVIKLKMK